MYMASLHCLYWPLTSGTPNQKIDFFFNVQTPPQPGHWCKWMQYGILLIGYLSIMCFVYFLERNIFKS